MSESTDNTQQKLQQIVDKVSSKRSKYQYILILYFCLLWIQITYSAMLSSYVFMNPLFQCDGKSVTELEACEHMLPHNQNRQYQQCKVTNSFTATFYDHLYCQGKSKRSAIQSIYAFGALVGMFGLPALADAKGRRFSLICSFVLQFFGITGMIVGIYQNIFTLIMIGQFATGVQASGAVILTYVITGQFCKQSTKQSAILLYCSLWGLTQMSYFILYNYLPQWNYYVIYVFHIPTIALMVLSFFVIFETPQYCLVMAKDINKFNKNIDKLSSYNQAPPQIVKQVKQIGVEILRSIQSNPNNKNSSNFKHIMAKIVKNKRYLTTVLCLSLTQLSYNIFYYGVQGSLQRTGYNFGFSMFLIGIHQFIAYLTTSYVINKIRRKRGLIAAIILTSGIGLTFLIDFVNQNNILQSIVISITRIGCVYAYSFLSILQTQSFPSQVKSTAIGLTIGLSQLGRIAVPYIVTTMNDIGVHPLIVSSMGFLIFGIFPLIPVKQTFKGLKKNDESQQSLISENNFDNQNSKLQN